MTIVLRGTSILIVSVCPNMEALREITHAIVLSVAAIRHLPCGRTRTFFDHGPAIGVVIEVIRKAHGIIGVLTRE